MKQSSIDWYIEQRDILENEIKHNILENAFRTNEFGLGTYFERKIQIEDQAKAMHKQEIVEAHGVKESYCAEGSRNLWQQTTGEQYYKEKYEREDNKH